MNNIEEYKQYLRNLILSDDIKRMGICFRTPNKKYFYDTGTGKIMECTEKEYLFLKQIFHREKECLDEDENQEIIAFKVLQENCDMTKKNNVILQFLNVICLMLTIIYSFYRAIKNHMLVGDFTLFISAFNKIIDYGVPIVDNFNQFIENANSYQDYINYMNIKEEENEGITIKKIKTIEFKDVSFKYPQAEKEVLSHINFYIDTNHKIAIIGKNGSGKSTIVKLLLGFYRPTQGMILVNGISIEKIDMNVYRKNTIKI